MVGLAGKKCKRSGRGSGNYSYRWPVRGRLPLPSHTWKHFGFPALRNGEGEKVTDRQEATC